MRESWWTEERVQELRRLEDNDLSVMQIACALGCTKNTVSGKRWRLGIGRAWRKAEPTPDHFPERGHCLWGMGHPGSPGFHFCGSPNHPGLPYCPAHAAIAYVQPKEEKAAA